MEMSHVANVQTFSTASSNIGLLAEIEETESDVVVLLSDSHDELGIVSHVLDAFPGVMVIVFNPTSRDAVVFKQQVTRQVLREVHLGELLNQVRDHEPFRYWRTEL